MVAGRQAGVGKACAGGNVQTRKAGVRRFHPDPATTKHTRKKSTTEQNQLETHR